MTLLRSIIFQIFFILFTALVCVIFLPIYVIFNINSLFLPKIWSNVCLKALKLICNISYEVRGMENIPKDKNVIFASKHQSAWETIFFYHLIDRPSYILKEELTKIPFYGKITKKLGNISIDRSGGGQSLKKMLRDIEQKLSENFSIVIFPEGTRKKTDEKPNYMPGILAIYTNKQIKAPIIPVALNSGVFWPKGAFYHPPGKVIIEILPAIPEKLSKKDFLEKLEKSIEKKTRLLVNEAKRECKA